MNANELANELDVFAVELTCKISGEAATMLRQQQVRIKQLEETQEYLYKTHDKDKAKLAAAEQYCLDAFERGKQIGYADGMMNGKDSVQNTEPFTKHEQGKEMNANELADELEAFHVDPDGFPYMVGEAINMLRQQQAEIEAMKDKLMLAKQSLEIMEGWTKK